MKRIIGSFLFMLLLGLNMSPAQESIKCYTPQIVRLHIAAHKNLKEAYVAVRPVMQTSILSPSGKFRIHFDTTGTNQPAMVTADGSTIPNTTDQYVDTLAKILDIVWRTEIDSFGFVPPPSDGGRGGGNELDVYVSNLGGGLFGYTDWDDDNELTPGKTNPQYSSFIHLDNDYGAGYRTKGVQAMLATCAHEFHHTIQIGSSGLWFDDFYFYELSAESMESTVFPTARDYLFDVKTYFNNIENIPLFLSQGSGYDGYERAIFGIFMMARYGHHFMQDVWNQIRTNRPVQAVENAFEEQSSTLPREYSEFALWNYYTGDRGDSIKYYPDAKRFPTLQFSTIAALSSQSQDIAQSIKNFATSYIRVIVANDTTDMMVSNLNLADALANYSTTYPFVVTLSPTSFAGSSQIGQSLFSSFSHESDPDPSHWNMKAFGEGFSVLNTTAMALPNPFNPDRSPVLISTGTLSGSPVSLTIVSASMDLIYSGDLIPKSYLGKSFVEWKGRDNKGKTISSGVYLYILTDKNNSVQKGKIAVIR